MRDPKRISKILCRLNKVWRKNDQLRLGQLICNIVQDPALYYIEDEILMNRLESFYNEEENVK